MEWSLFLYYCCYCLNHNVPGKTYKEFFEDKELVVLTFRSYLSQLESK